MPAVCRTLLFMLQFVNSLFIHRHQLIVCSSCRCSNEASLNLLLAISFFLHSRLECDLSLNSLFKARLEYKDRGGASNNVGNDQTAGQTRKIPRECLFDFATNRSGAASNLKFLAQIGNQS